MIQNYQHLLIKLQKYTFLFQGPSAFFFGGNDRDLGTGEYISYPHEENIFFRPNKLGAIRKRDITLKLPKTLNAYEMLWLSVWCDVFEISFGHVLFE